MNHDHLTTINEVLRAQLEALSHIETILDDERRALEARAPDELLAAANAKTQALAQLSELEAQRKSMSAGLNGIPDPELRAIAARLRSMNQENAALLNAQQQHVNRLLGLLRGNRDSQPSAYDATGRTTGGTSQQLRLTQV